MKGYIIKFATESKGLHLARTSQECSQNDAPKNGSLERLFICSKTQVLTVAPESSSFPQTSRLLFAPGQAGSQLDRWSWEGSRKGPTAGATGGKRQNWLYQLQLKSEMRGCDNGGQGIFHKDGIHENSWKRQIFLPRLSK